jgi:hypothetical protein
MNWSNLLSGVIGALLGGLLAIVASLMSARQQRSLTLATLAEERRQTQLQISYTACAEILSDMLTIKRAMIDLMAATRADAAAVFRTVYSTVERIFIVHNSVVAEGDLRERINQLKDLMEQWYEKTDWVTERSVQQERYDLIMPFMEYVNLSIRAHMNDQPLPPSEIPPSLATEEEPPASADQLSNA